MIASHLLNESAGQPRSTPAYLWIALLVLCTIQFTAAWLYPPATFGGVGKIILIKQFGVPFQYGLWMLIVIGLGLHLFQNGIATLNQVLLPFIPFLLAGVIAATFGFDVMASFRMLGQWLAMALAATIIAQNLDATRVWRALLIVLLLLMASSALVAIVMPRTGTELYGFHSVWRGVFTNKNQLGWIAALTLLVSAGMPRGKSWLLKLITFALATVCLLASDSKGALLGALCALGYQLFISKLIKKTSPGFGMVVVMWLLALFVIAGISSLPSLLEFLNRDPTLTGRTEIWQLYFNSMMHTPWFGQGPGAYTALSPITLPLSNRLGQDGAIVTPHNSFLGAFGDAGFMGLLSFASLLVYLSIIAPMRRASAALQASASIAFLMITLGMVETHDVFAAGPGWFLLILSRSVAIRELDVAYVKSLQPKESPVDIGLDLAAAAPP
jgi:O-antigen ligase